MPFSALSQVRDALLSLLNSPALLGKALLVDKAISISKVCLSINVELEAAAQNTTGKT